MVIGATGMLGQKIVVEAQARGLSPLGVARSGSDIDLDITDDAALAAVLATHRPDLVINCAAIIDIGECENDTAAAYRINARAVAVLAGLCREGDIKLVQVSSDHYFTGDGDAPHDEAAPVTLLHDYARTKYAAEAFALTAPGALVARLNVIGLRGWQKPTFAEWAIEAINGDAEITLFEDSFVSSIDTGACARALFDLVDAGAGGIFNLGSRQVFSKQALIEALASAMGRKMTRAKTGTVRSLDVARAESLGLDVTKSEKLLGYRLPTLQQVATALIGEYEGKA